MCFFGARDSNDGGDGVDVHVWVVQCECSCEFDHCEPKLKATDCRGRVGLEGSGQGFVFHDGLDGVMEFGTVVGGVKADRPGCGLGEASGVFKGRAKRFACILCVSAVSSVNIDGEDHFAELCDLASGVGGFIFDLMGD